MAVLAHISTEYYIRLEQGRAPRPSGDVLAAIAGALRLTDAETDHLHLLAGTAPTRARLHRREVVDALPEGHRDTAAGAAQRLLIDPETDLLSRRVVAEEVPDTVVAEVRRAVFAGHRLRIHYAAVDQAPKWRTVDPIGLVTVRGQGYLLATRSGADRTYRLARVLAAKELDEPAQRPDRVDLDRAWQERSTRFRTGGDQVAVLVRVNPARREDLVGTALAVIAEETDPDGWLRLEVTFQDSRHAEWALWQLATNAEALAPQWLRSSLRDRAAASATCYGVPS